LDFAFRQKFAAFGFKAVIEGHNSNLKIGLIMFIESARALIDLVEICKTAAKLTEKGTKDRSFEM
jgi:hypothetical protein